FDTMVHLPSVIRVLTLVLITSLLLQTLGLALPLLTQVLIDRVLKLQQIELMGILALGMGVVTVSQMFMYYVRGHLLIWLQARLDVQLMRGFFEHLLSLPFTFFQQRTTGDLMMRLSSNTTIRELLTGQMLSIL